MHLVPLVRPVPHQEPADDVRNLVFLANLAAQETTGETASSTSVERVQHRLRGSVEYDTVAYAAYLSPAAEADDDPAGYLLVSTPQLEDLDVAEIEIILDAGLLPLPGAPLPAESRDVLMDLHAHAEQVARDLGRHVIQTWLLHSADEEPGTGDRADLLRARGYRLEVTEIQGVVSVEEATAPEWTGDVRVDVVRDLAFPEELVDGVLSLYRQASLDVPVGQMVAEPVDWTRERLAAAARRVVGTGRAVVSVVLSDGTGVIGISEITRFPGSEPEVAEQGITVIAPRARGRSHGLNIKRTVLHEAATLLPGVRRVYTSNATDNTWMVDINRRLGWRVVSGGSGWQKVY